jgi:16S rRNA (cytidine1402-2'-O)-methyltransferase
MPGNLYIVATPIGNLEDIAPRALTTLRSVSAVLAEDTRQARKLLAHYDIHVPIERFDAHVDRRNVAKAIERLRNGESFALVTDAGTPAISDPGSWLVSEAVRELGEELKAVPIPGPSSVTAALSISGFPADSFVFYGFVPPKKGRAARLEEIAGCGRTAVFFESPHRIEKTLTELWALCPTRRAVVCRELTKMFETIYRGTVEELAKPNAIRPQGEFVVVLGPKR